MSRRLELTITLAGVLFGFYVAACCDDEGPPVEIEDGSYELATLSDGSNPTLQSASLCIEGAQFRLGIVDTRFEGRVVQVHAEKTFSTLSGP